MQMNRSFSFLMLWVTAAILLTRSIRVHSFTVPQQKFYRSKPKTATKSVPSRWIGPIQRGFSDDFNPFVSAFSVRLSATSKPQSVSPSTTTPAEGSHPSPASANPSQEIFSASTSPSGETLGPPEETRSKVNLVIRAASFLRWVLRNVRPRRAKNRIGGRARGSTRRQRWMKSPAFHRLTKWAFEICDVDQSGRINSEQLYSGVLLVHLHLAKSVGIAACQPLNRTQVHDLFQTADVDGDGTISIADFEEIVFISCTHIGARMAVLSLMLAIVTPALLGVLSKGAKKILQAPPQAVWYPTLLHIDSLLSAILRQFYQPILHWSGVLGEWLLQHVVSIFLFVGVTPWIFDRMDRHTSRFLKIRRWNLMKQAKFQQISLPQNWIMAQWKRNQRKQSILNSVPEELVAEEGSTSDREITMPLTGSTETSSTAMAGGATSQRLKRRNASQHRLNLEFPFK